MGKFGKFYSKKLFLEISLSLFLFIVRGNVYMTAGTWAAILNTEVETESLVWQKNIWHKKIGP